MKEAPGAPGFHLTQGGVALLAVAAGASVANSYYNQPILPFLARDFGLADGTVTLVPFLTQLGNACGLLFLAPLGDMLERKRLALVTATGLALALAAAALAPTFSALLVASVAIGLCGNLTQQLVPFATLLAKPDERGRVLGTVTGGILIGILGARAAGGIIAEHMSWRYVFAFGAGLITVIGMALAVYLPTAAPKVAIRYPDLIRSLWLLVRTYPALRRASGVQFFVFAAFMGFWSQVALYLTAPPYSYSGWAIGYLALIGIAGALSAPFAGALVDRGSPRQVVRLAAAAVVAAYGLFAVWGGLVVIFAAALFLLDLAVQTSQVANQAYVQKLDPDARSRVNTVFMAMMLAGGAFGAGVSGVAFAMAGWFGTCLCGAAFGMVGFVLARRL